MGLVKDILVTAGLDLGEYEKGLQRMSSETTRAQREMEQSSKRMGLAQVGAYTLAALAADKFTSSIVEGGAQASELTKSWEKIDRSKYADFYSDSNTQQLKNFTGAAMGFIEIIPGVNTGLSYFLAKNEDVANQRAISNAIFSQAEGYGQLTVKLKNIQDLRAKERGLGIGGERMIYEEKAFAQALDATASAYVKQAQAEEEAYSIGSASAKEHVELVQLELDKRAKIAALTESLKSPNGNITRENQRVLAASVRLLDEEYKFHKANIDLVIMQQEAQRDLNELSAQTGSSLPEKLKMEKAVLVSLQAQYQKAKELLGEHHMITAALAAQARAQGMNILDQRASELEKTPAQRRRERKEYARHFRHMRRVAEQERINEEADARPGANTNRHSNRDFQPKDPADAIGGFIQRQQNPGRQFAQLTSEIKTGHITAASLVVTELKSK